MVYDVEGVKRDVRVCLDQNVTSDALLDEADIDTLSLDEIIGSKVVDAAVMVERMAPVEFLEQGHVFGDAVYWDDGCSGHVLLPDDFMRLVVFEMSDWGRGVFSAIGCDAPEYALQRQRVRGLRGTYERPVCAIVSYPEGLVLEFFSCRSEDAYIKRALYVPYPCVDGNGGIDISERCYGAVVYMAASLVLITLGEADKAALLSDLAKGLLR